MRCYICRKNATSIEHAPARCFFPKGKRNNLITVESCVAHNEDTSKDDEYVRNIIAMSIGNNEVALKHFLDKCIRSFKKSPNLLKTTTKVKKNIYVSERQEVDIKRTDAFQINRKRFDFVMRKIAYAIYFKKYDTTWNRGLDIGTEYLRKGDMKADELGLLIQGSKKLIDISSYEGNNQDVFKYIFLATESDDTNDQLLIMKFYEGFEVWVFPQKDTVKPNI